MMMMMAAMSVVSMIIIVMFVVSVAWIFLRERQQRAVAVLVTNRIEMTANAIAIGMAHSAIALAFALADGVTSAFPGRRLTINEQTLAPPLHNWAL